MRRLLLALPMFAACGSSVPDPQVNGVFPDNGFIGRKVRVEVSGDGSEWSNSATINFGDGITVDTIAVGSPSTLFADITIAPTATAGLHDVTVTDGGKSLVLAQSFELRSPVAITAQSLTQGGFGSVVVQNLDLENPFDTSTDAMGNSVVTLTAGSGVTLFVQNVSEFSLSAAALIDTDGASGPLTIVSGGLTSPGDMLAVTPRTATALTAGTGANTTLVDEGTLFSFTAASAGLLNVGIALTDPNDPNGDSPVFAILPASGKWIDQIGFDHPEVSNRIVAAGDKFFYVVFDGGNVPGAGVTLTPKAISLTGVTAVTDANNNETALTGQTVTGPVAQFNGTLTDDTDIDCVRINTGAANKKIHVYTTDEDVATDTFVQVFDTDNTTELTLTGGDDFDLGEDGVTDPIAVAGTHGVCISSGSNLPNATGAPYKAFIVLE